MQCQRLKFPIKRIETQVALLLSLWLFACFASARPCGNEKTKETNWTQSDVSSLTAMICLHHIVLYNLHHNNNRTPVYMRVRLKIRDLRTIGFPKTNICGLMYFEPHPYIRKIFIEQLQTTMYHADRECRDVV